MYEVKYGSLFLSNNRLHPWWVTGIADSEGNFSINCDYQKRKVNFSFKVTQKDSTMLYKLKDYFGVGSVVIDNSKFSAYKFVVSSTKDIAIIFKHFMDFPLVGSKQLDYLAWKQAYDVYVTDKDFDAVVKIKSGMNSGRSFEERWYHLFNKTITIQPEWLQAFINGDGSFQSYFNTVLNKVRGKSYKVSYIRLEIAQNSHEVKLLHAIRLFFGRGYIKPAFDITNLDSVKNSRKVSRYIITADNSLIEFFNKYPMIGVKNDDFLDWSKLYNLKLEGAHKTESGLLKMTDIKNRMNAGRFAINNTDKLATVESDKGINKSRKFSSFKKNSNTTIYVKLKTFIRDFFIAMLFLFLLIIYWVAILLIENDQYDSTSVDDYEDNERSIDNSLNNTKDNGSYKDNGYVNDNGSDNDNPSYVGYENNTNRPDIFEEENIGLDRLFSEDQEEEENLTEDELEMLQQLANDELEAELNTPEGLARYREELLRLQREIAPEPELEDTSAGQERPDLTEVQRQNLENFNANITHTRDDNGNYIENNGSTIISFNLELSERILEIIKSIGFDNVEPVRDKDRNIYNLKLDTTQIDTLVEQLTTDESLRRDLGLMERDSDFKTPDTASPVFNKFIDDLKSGKEIDIFEEFVNDTVLDTSASDALRTKMIRLTIFSKIKKADESQEHPLPLPSWTEVAKMPSNENDREAWEKDNQIKKAWAEKLFPNPIKQDIPKSDKPTSKDIFDEDDIGLDKLFNEDNNDK